MKVNFKIIEPISFAGYCMVFTSLRRSSQKTFDLMILMTEAETVFGVTSFSKSSYSSTSRIRTYFDENKSFVDV